MQHSLDFGPSNYTRVPPHLDRAAQASQALCPVDDRRDKRAPSKSPHTNNPNPSETTPEAGS